ncbi:MAG TPA: PQQ-binding-like beta-propeller repeat protein, partial [Chitinophagaceae bacterium]|nr:PQQ-binding-like beta-propeller repeat protein [Chitinophagaceae bacterium]
MKHNWTKVFLSAVTVTTLFSACKPTPDTDTPFPPKVSTSVFIGSKNEFVYALDPTTGTKKWECNVNANIEASPVLYNGVLFVGNSSPVLFKIDPNTGARSQSKIGFPAGIAATPLGDEHYIYIASGKRITCIDIVPDTVRWAFDADDNINSTPTIKDTQLVFGCDDGKVYMLDKRNKNVIWKTAAYSTQFRSSPVIDPTPVYFSSSVPVTMDTGAVYLGAQNF